MTLYFNNQFKMGPRPSTTVPTNDITIDISATPAGMSAATASKHFENIHMNQRMTGHPNQEKDLGLKYNCMSLLEPDWLDWDRRLFRTKMSRVFLDRRWCSSSYCLVVEKRRFYVIEYLLWIKISCLYHNGPPRQWNALGKTNLQEVKSWVSLKEYLFLSDEISKRFFYSVSNTKQDEISISISSCSSYR